MSYSEMHYDEGTANLYGIIGTVIFIILIVFSLVGCDTEKREVIVTQQDNTLEEEGDLEGHVATTVGAYYGNGGAHNPNNQYGNIGWNPYGGGFKR